jgi:hypothetical protein
VGFVFLKLHHLDGRAVFVNFSLVMNWGEEDGVVVINQVADTITVSEDMAEIHSLLEALGEDDD